MNCARPPASLVLRLVASVNTTPGCAITVAVDVSLTFTEAVCPATTKLSVSSPSVILSANRLTAKLALPVASVLRVPLNSAPSTSPLLMPVPDRL